jgi:hypothetical protein
MNKKVSNKITGLNVKITVRKRALVKNNTKYYPDWGYIFLSDVVIDSYYRQLDSIIVKYLRERSY